MQVLYDSYKMRLELTTMRFVRSFHDEINWDNRLIGLLGAKGVGKSTLLLQHIKLTETQNESLYIQADDFYFSDHRLYDVARQFMSRGGKFLYIDEIHKYRGWSTEIKVIYDTMPQLKVVYSGSSILDLQRGGADLSRRAMQYTMTGLSFREYLNIRNGWNLAPATMDDVLAGKVDFPFDKGRPLQYFGDYLRTGYYPFFAESDYLPKLRQAIMVAVEYDIPHYAEMNITSAAKLKKLLYVLAQSVPFKPNYSELERDLGISRNTLPDYIDYLEKARLLSALRKSTIGKKVLRKIDKLYLDNPNIAYAITDTTPDIGNIRETVFLTWLKDRTNIVASPISDFEIDGKTFELGGRGKGKRQIMTAAEGYVVKDDIEYAYDNIIPLWMFGFVY